MKKLEDFIYDVPDFPIPGIIFRDITGVLNNAEGLQLAIDELKNKLEGVEFDAIAGTEARGFLFGVPLAYATKKRFVPIRKRGKLPRETIQKTYNLEYGTATLEAERDSINPGDRVVIVDDLIATGGTVKAVTEIIEELGGEVAKCLFLIELEGLKGREILKGYDVDSVIKYPGA